MVLPASEPWSQVALRLTAEDISGNRIIYEADPAYLVPPIRVYIPLVEKDYTSPPKPTLTDIWSRHPEN